jgi:hypothetical protein
MTRANRTADFLQNMTAEIATEATPPKPVRAAATRRPTEKAPAPSRAGLKHIGGYLDDETVEKVAVLRARLKLDNSQLIKRAVDDLYSKQAAKRAFGDA